MLHARRCAMRCCGQHLGGVADSKLELELALVPVQELELELGTGLVVTITAAALHLLLPHLPKTTTRWTKSLAHGARPTTVMPPSLLSLLQMSSVFTPLGTTRVVAVVVAEFDCLRLRVVGCRGVFGRGEVTTLTVRFSPPNGAKTKRHRALLVLRNAYVAIVAELMGTPGTTHMLFDDPTRVT